MARASTPTWLPLDRWAEIIGLDPLHFNGVTTTLRPDRACNSGEDIWMQFAYQDASKISREDLAEAIRDAEQQISNYVGYHLLPDWVTGERRQTVRPALRELYSGGLNVRWMGKSVTAGRAHVIAGGQKAKTLIAAGAAIARTDADGDGYDELCTVTVASTVDVEEVRVYFPNQSGADEWEIRPVKVTAAGGNLTITFKIWQVPLPAQWEALNARGIDGDVPANFETTVDVYRLYNDPQSQLQLLWEGGGCGSCAACTFGAQNGCLHVRDPRLGIVAYAPAEWDASAGSFSAAELAACRDPEQLRLWYYSGWRWDTSDPRRRAAVDMDPYWEKAVAYYATALLLREVCSCNNTEKFLDWWREDVGRVGSEVSYQNDEAVLSNPFGTRRGGIYAWERCNQEGRKVQP